MQWVLILLTAVTGVLNTIQSGSNTTLNKTLQSPMWSVVIVFTVAWVTALGATLVSGQRLPTSGSLALVPWWAWIGGVFGAVYILMMMLAAEKVGAAVFMAIIVTTAILTSLVMDHFGLMGFTVRTAGVGRIIGGVFMIAGLGLIAAF